MLLILPVYEVYGKNTSIYIVYSRVLVEIMWPVLGQNIIQIRQDLMLIVQSLAVSAVIILFFEGLLNLPVSVVMSSFSCDS